ncbi:MAG: pyridoxamine 5'-phosphate oxidase family protein [Actinomycetota bacterium]|nr:pyridoxamine 5'-phosphate oxidase family protein [Actinomycetota bacterium]
MPDPSYPLTAQTTPSRRTTRLVYDRAAVHAVLDEAVLCHVGFVIDGKPVVLPQLHARVGEQLYLHGSTGARAMQAATDDGGLAVCVTVTLIDGLVLARSSFNHSINYRSVVIHGIAKELTREADKQAALAALVEAVVPGRSAAVRGPSRKELAATTVLRLDLEAVSIKSRTGPPDDEESDLDLPFWAGVLPLASLPGTPAPAPDLSTAIPTPDHVTSWARPSMKQAP